MTTLTLTQISDREIARIRAALVAMQAEQESESRARAWLPVALTIEDVAYHLLIQGLIVWEMQQSIADAAGSTAEPP